MSGPDRSALPSDSRCYNFFEVLQQFEANKPARTSEVIERTIDKKVEANLSSNWKYAQQVVDLKVPVQPKTKVVA